MNQIQIPMLLIFLLFSLNMRASNALSDAKSQSQTKPAKNAVENAPLLPLVQQKAPSIFVQIFTKYQADQKMIQHFNKVKEMAKMQKKMFITIKGEIDKTKNVHTRYALTLCHTAVLESTPFANNAMYIKATKNKHMQLNNLKENDIKPELFEKIFEMWDKLAQNHSAEFKKKGEELSSSGLTKADIEQYSKVWREHMELRAITSLGDLFSHIQ